MTNFIVAQWCSTVNVQIKAYPYHTPMITEMPKSKESMKLNWDFQGVGWQLKLKIICGRDMEFSFTDMYYVLDTSETVVSCSSILLLAPPL